MGRPPHLYGSIRDDAGRLQDPFEWNETGFNEPLVFAGHLTKGGA